MTNLHRLYEEFGQSPWVDFVDRPFIESGGLERLIDQGIRGLTSNPTIFAKAISGGHYDELITERLSGGASNEAVFEEIAVQDVGDAADLLRRVYDTSDGTDGFASLEVEPGIAMDTRATLERARHLFSRLGRPNVFIKIPATEAGIPAISDAIAEGINVNVTLLFSVGMYERVARAYIAGLEQRHRRGEDISRVSSVASFFVSRVDTKVDKELDGLGTTEARELRGKAGIANAKLAYHTYQQIFGGPEFQELRAAGARVQRCLWASTSTKDPAYPDTIYADNLIGPDTVDTLPMDTIKAFMDHGRLAETLTVDVEGARETLRRLDAIGIPIDRVTAELLDEGVEKFGASFDELTQSIESKCAELTPA